MMRNLLFRPMFNPVDMLTTTAACGLMLSGHWLASVPVMLLGAWAYWYGKKQQRRMMAVPWRPRKVR